MTHYCFHLFRGPEPVGAIDGEHADDLGALEAAHRLCRERTVEIYDVGRLVARVNQGDEPAGIGGRSGYLMRVADKAIRRTKDTVQTTRELILQSDVTMAQSWDVRCSSHDAVNRSKEKLSRMAKGGSSSWQPYEPPAHEA